MDLSQRGCIENFAYKFFLISAVLTALIYVADLGYSVYERKARESSMADHWLSECEFQEQIGCERVLDNVKKTCLREARTSSREGIVFKPLVFFECVNERNDAGVRLAIPEDLAD